MARSLPRKNSQPPAAPDFSALGPMPYPSAMPNDHIAELLRHCEPARPCETVAHWWPRWRAIAAAWPEPFDRAIASGGDADRLGWAFAGGYQSALRALDASIPDAVIAALCVTEADGNHPRAIRTTLTPEAGGFRVSGEKRWSTLGPGGGLFLVIAREAGGDEARPALRTVRIPTGAAGLVVETMPPTAFVPEVPHARIRLENVRVEAGAVMDGDAYTHCVKPFRTIEDIYVHAATVAYLIGEARRRGWPPAWVERALALLHGLARLSLLDPLAPATHIALAGALANGSALLAEADAFWAAAGDDPAAFRWTRDRKLTAVAGKARERRLATAWARL